MTNQELLIANTTSIEQSFITYNSRNTYMGVYFTQLNKPYITFSATDTFPLIYKIGRNTCNYGYTFITAEDYQTQYAAFVAV